MKRVGFKRRRTERQRAPLIGMRGGARGVLAPVNASEFAAVPKRVAVRSQALLEACRLIPCQSCCAMDGTVCAAHSNWGEHGKGGQQKADDNRVAALCAVCHHALDQGSLLSGEERRAMWDAAHEHTVVALVGARLWPVETPLPPEWESVIVDGVIVELRRA